MKRRWYKIMKKIGIYSLIFLLVFSLIPMPSIDLVSAESEKETEDIVLFAEEEGDIINLYPSEEYIEADETEIDIPDESEALLIHNDSTFEYEDQLYVYIQYKDEDSEDDTDQLVEGYVNAERVVLSEEVEEFLENRQQGEETESDDHNSDEAKEAENDESSEDNDGNADNSEENDEQVEEDEENTDSEENDKSPDNNEGNLEDNSKRDVPDELKDGSESEDGKDEKKQEVTEHEHDNDKASTYSNDSVSYSGVALKNKTHVYSQQSRDSDILKSYSEGSVLKYSYVTDLNENWYRTGVFINGKKQTGYIHKSDV